MEREIYIIKSDTNPFKIWKTYNNEDQTDRERYRDIKNNYPIIIPKSSIYEIRFDALTTDDLYHYGLTELDSNKGEIYAIIEIDYDGIIAIRQLKNGKIKLI